MYVLNSVFCDYSLFMLTKIFIIAFFFIVLCMGLRITLMIRSANLNEKKYLVYKYAAFILKLPTVRYFKYIAPVF